MRTISRRQIAIKKKSRPPTLLSLSRIIRKILQSGATARLAWRFAYAQPGDILWIGRKAWKSWILLD
jgi:hypothetical protein